MGPTIEELTFGHCDELTAQERTDVITIWLAALWGTDYQPKHSSCERVRDPNRSRLVGIKGDLVALFGIAGVVKPSDEVFDYAVAGGVDIMLDSYFSGVPFEHIVA